jgi:hypothetical protein
MNTENQLQEKSLFYKGEKIETSITGGINSAGGLCYRATIEGIQVTKRIGGTSYKPGWRETTAQNQEKLLRSEIRNFIELR